MGTKGGLSQSRLVRRYYAADAWTWAFLDLIGQVKFLTLLRCCLVRACKCCCPSGRRWIQSRLTLLVLLGFIHGLLFWDGDILLAYGLVEPNLLAAGARCAIGKSLFNTGVTLYLVGLGVLLLLGLISDEARPAAPGRRMHRLFCMKNTGNFTVGVEAINNRADGVGNSLLALGAQYGWQLAGMMLIGAALMRSGWLKRAVQLTSLSSYWFCAGGDWGDH